MLFFVFCSKLKVVQFDVSYPSSIIFYRMYIYGSWGHVIFKTLQWTINHFLKRIRSHLEVFKGRTNMIRYELKPRGFHGEC